MVVGGLAFLLGVAYRHAEFGEDDGEIESTISKNGSYYLTNIVMLMAGVLVAYLTVSSALPSWMPLGGAVVAAGAYNAVARPVAVFVVLLMAVCPMLGWRKTDRSKFARHMRVPAIAGAAVFVALMAYFALVLVPEYHEIIAAGGAAGEALAEQGPAVYYFGLTALAFASAALLFTSSLYLLGRGVRGRMRAKGERMPLALVNLFRRSPAQAGGYLCHLGVAIVVVGLVGSMMYVREAAVNLAGEAGESVRVGAYELTFTDSERYSDDQNNEIMRVELDVTNAETGRPLSLIHISAPGASAAVAFDATDADAVSASVEDAPSSDDLAAVMARSGATAYNGSRSAQLRRFTLPDVYKRQEQDPASVLRFLQPSARSEDRQPARRGALRPYAQAVRQRRDLRSL